LGAAVKGSFAQLAAASFCRAHEFGALPVQLVDGSLFLHVGQMGVVGLEFRVLFNEAVTADVLAQRLVVGFSRGVTLGLQFAAWETDELWVVFTNERGHINVYNEESVIPHSSSMGRLENMLEDNFVSGKYS
jgi:hypothetical protein